MAADGPAEQSVAAYLETGGGSPAERTWADHESGPGDNVARLKSVRVIGEDGAPASRVSIQRPVALEVEYWFFGDHNTPRVDVFLDVCNKEGILLFVTQDANNKEWRHQRRSPGLVRSTCWLPGNLLSEGTHTVHATLGASNPRVTHVHERDAVAFQVVDHTEEDGVRGDWPSEWPGVMRPMLEWTVEMEPEGPPSRGASHS